MKRPFYYLLIFTLMLGISACSSDSEGGGEEQMQEETGVGDISLRFNGSGLSDETAKLFRENIEELDGGASIRISVRNMAGYRFIYRFPLPIEKLQYSTIDYNINKDFSSSVTVPGTGIFLSKSGGRLTITDIIENGDCVTYKGNLSINYRRQDNSPGELNVQGSFELPNFACE